MIRDRIARWSLLAVSAVAVAALLAAVAAVADEAPRPVSAVLTVRVDVKRAAGQVGCALFHGPSGFPGDTEKAVERRFCAIDAKTLAATCVFKPHPADEYAVACFHDEDGDGALKTGLFGIPVEGTGVSRNARGILGPPHYADARFLVSAPTTAISIVIDE
jgi:uncharacterized protein (DUF2141 family)